uniref:Non-structural maintenance of chromosomes element 4 n=1 Tax=Latimeria chalumnae TaxID=7897 RepID=M3XKQ8_LATCH
MSGQERTGGNSNNGPQRHPRCSDGDGATESGSNAKNDDPDTRRIIRHQYRELINSVQQNRMDMLNPTSNKLTEALEEANKLFNNVNQAREAALDAQFLVLASNLGKEKANQLHSDMTVFDPAAFVEDLLTFMGLNRLDGYESDSEDDNSVGGFLPNDAWYKLGKEADKYFKRAPVFHYMLGSFKADPPAPRQRIERQRKDASTEEQRMMPAQVWKPYSYSWVHNTSIRINLALLYCFPKIHIRYDA